MRSLWQRFVTATALLVLLTARGGLANNADGSCSKSSPCEQGCCGESGYCGFGPKYCGKGCLSGCDAQAECGQYAPISGQKCPLNVCCSEFGFCGTTSDFCGKNCQSGCDKPEKPSCSGAGASASKRTIGYWESWSTTRPCDAWKVSDIDATKWTHLNFAFALIDKSTYAVAQMAPGDTKQYTQLTDLKRMNPSLKVFISVGGWSAGGAVFSSMTSSYDNRRSFIVSLQAFMKMYAFDGVDIDWEYPVAADRGGKKADYANFVTFLKELRDALGNDYGITATLPSSYWYLQYFDIKGMEQYLDWFNVMTYDIHGTWDGANKFTKKVVQAHTNLTEIDLGLDLLWRNGIDSKKVVMGLGFYGRAFTLQDPSCKKPGCPFSGGAKKGKCTGESGILSNSEIQDIISENGLTPTLVKEDAIKYMVWNTDQWVSYDDEETLKMKLDYANKLCLGGTMIWALDLDKPGKDTSVDSLIGSGFQLDPKWGGSKRALLSARSAAVRSNSYALGLFWTACLPMNTPTQCPQGYRAIAYGHGKVFDADLSHLTGEGCHGGGINGYQRALCAAANVQYGSLMWGPGGKSKACNSKCPAGWVTLSKNSHITGQKSGCKSGRYAPLCAQNVIVQPNHRSCPTTPAGHLLSGGLSQHEDIDSLFQFGLRGGPGDFTFAGMSRRQETQIKRKRGTHGTYLDILCKEPNLAFDQIPADVPARIEEVRLGDQISYGSMNPQINTLRLVIPTFSATPVTMHTTTTTYITRPRTCDGGRYPQACAHYSSVITQQGSPASLLTCSNLPISRDIRPLVSIYSTDQHSNKVWRSYIASSYIAPVKGRRKLGCQMDEWPPAHFQMGTNWGWIRLLPGDQNGGVPNHAYNSDQGSGWQRFCKFPPHSSVVRPQGGPAGIVVVTTIITLNVMSYTWKNIVTSAGDPQALTANVCRPSVLTADVGYALFTDDPWYTSQGIVINGDYNSHPGPKTINAPFPVLKRGSEPVAELDLVEGNLIVDDGFSSRELSDEEIESLGYARCATPECDAELAILREQQAALASSLPHVADTAASTVVSTPTTASQQPASKPTYSVVQATATVSESRSEGHLRRHVRHAHRHGH